MGLSARKSRTTKATVEGWPTLFDRRTNAPEGVERPLTTTLASRPGQLHLGDDYSRILA